MYTRSLRFILALGAIVLAAQSAMSQNETGFLYTDNDLQVAVPLGVELPVIELTYVGGFIDSEDRIQTRVFVEGDASEPRYVLEVYRPAYMKEAGTFRSELSEAEFQQLLRAFGNKNVLEMPQADLSNQVNMEAMAAQGPDILDEGTHDAQVKIEFRLGPQTGMESSTPPAPRSLSVPTSALQSAARAETVVTRNVASGVLTLEGLVRRKELERVE